MASIEVGKGCHLLVCIPAPNACHFGTQVVKYLPVGDLSLRSASVRIGVTTDELTNVNVVVSAPSTVTVHDSARSLLASRPYDEHRMTTTEPIDANLLVAGRSTTSAGSHETTTGARREHVTEVPPTSVNPCSGGSPS